MCPVDHSEQSKAESAKLMEAIGGSFGSFEAFVEEFSATAANQFGSGWAWLVQDISGKLQIIATANQDSPLLQ